VTDNWAAGGRFGYRLTSRASLRLGYHYRRSTSPFYFGGQPIVGHDLDVGIDYNRALSLSRKTTVGFTTGTSIYRSFSPNGNPSGADYIYKTHYLVTGTAYLNRQMGRSWTGRLSYQRGLQFVQGFGNPFFVDSVSASLGGFAGAKSRLNFLASYSNGQVGMAIADQNYKSYQGTADYQFALNRLVALSADYTYYHYDFAQTVALPSGMSRGLNRQSIRVGLNFWLPLLR
jgi:opacity protein-like surface antigen